MDFHFLTQFLAKSRQIGSILPSSMALARTMAGCISTHRNSDSLSVLELGAGTGAITRGLVETLNPLDWLTCIEMNPAFAHPLRERLREWRTGGKVCHLELFEGNFLRFDPVAPYDWVVCGLPLNNFSVDGIEAISRKVHQILKPSGYFVFFEYAKIRRIKSLISGPKEKARLNALDEIYKRVIVPKAVVSKIVWTNVPPALVTCVRCV